MLLFADSLDSYMLNRLDIFGSLRSDGGSGRLQIWDAGFQKFKDSNVLQQLFGHGFGTFPNVVHYIAIGHTKPYEAHNIFIDCLITGGIVGCALLLTAFISAIVLNYKSKNIFGVLATIALLVASMALDLQNYKAFALVFAVSSIFSQCSEKSNQRSYRDAIKCNCPDVQNRKVSARLPG